MRDPRFEIRDSTKWNKVRKPSIKYPKWEWKRVESQVPSRKSDIYIYIHTPENEKKESSKKYQKAMHKMQYTNTRCTEIRWHSDIGKKKKRKKNPFNKKCTELRCQTHTDGKQKRVKRQLPSTQCYSSRINCTDAQKRSKHRHTKHTQRSTDKSTKPTTDTRHQRRKTSQGRKKKKKTDDQVESG